MRIEFTLNKDYDTKYIWFLLSKGDWPEVESRAKLMGFDLELTKKIFEAKTEKKQKAVQREVASLVDNTYLKLLPVIENSKNLYQQSWDEIIDVFSPTVEELTLPWFYQFYTCVVTHFHPGIANWNGNVIGRWWKENSYLQRRITAHEIFLSHYFSIYRHYYPNCGLRDQQIWALAEIAAFALTGLEDRLKKFWPWDDQGYYTDHNYPQIVDLQLQLEKPFLKRRNFREYVEEGINLIKNQGDLRRVWP